MKILDLPKWWRGVCLISMALVCQSFGAAQEQTDPPYEGYRLHLTNLKVLKKKDQQIKINYTLINTGREPVQLGNAQAPEALLILFDQSLTTANLLAYQTEIKEQLLKEQLSIAAGQINSDRELTFHPQEIMTARGGESEKMEKPVELETKIEETEIEAETVIAATETETTEAVDAPAAPAVEMSTPAEEMPAALLPEEPATTAAEPEAAKQEKEIIPYLDKDNCADLKIDQIGIVKKSKNSITLSYTITNYGTGVAALFGESDKKEDNVAIRANISGSTKLSRGAIIIGGDYLSKNKRSKKKELAPFESYQGTIKLDTRKMTRFTPNIILELDVYNSIIECDETNNRQHIVVE
ncbi:MAG: hypothetical protein AAGG75_20170 [Bacteroidota bacterium]